jgi:mannose-1-phosphate guanylyltransferase
MKAFEEYSQEVYKGVKEISEKAGKENLDKLLEEVYGKLGSPDSIDYEVSEKVKNLVVIPGDFGWSDVGDWKVVFDLREKNMHGLAVNGETEVVNIGSKNLLIDAGKKLVAAVGVEDLIMVSNEFFLEALKSVGSQQVAIELTTGTKPLILKEVGHTGWTHVIMQKTAKGN